MALLTAPAATPFRSLPDFVRRAQPGQQWLDVHEVGTDRRVWTYVVRDRINADQLLVDAIATEHEIGRLWLTDGYRVDLWPCTLTLDEGRAHAFTASFGPCQELARVTSPGPYSPRRLRSIHGHVTARHTTA